MKSHSCALPYETIKNIIEQEIEALTPRKAHRIFKLKYSLQQLFPLPNKLLTALILFLLTGRFPLLFSSTPSLKFQDQSIKQLYQQELHTSKLTVPHNFEHFVIIAIKLSIKIIESQYVEVVVGSQEEQEMYCLVMKVLIGLQVVPSCYRLILQKYKNEKDQYMGQLETANVAIKVKEFNDSQVTKGVITMNAIQSKMMKKKQKQTKIDRPSIQMFPTNKNLQNFKEDLNKSLKVDPPKKGEPIKRRYRELEDIANHTVDALDIATKEKLPERRLRKRMIHTEQVSSSMQLKLLLEQKDPSYSKRNVKLRHSRPSPHLTNRVYDTSKENGSKQRVREIFPHLERRSVNMRKTGSYWKGIKNNISKMTKEMYI